MIRHLPLGLAALAAAAIAMSHQAACTEVEMRMRGSGETFTGKLISFDGTVYVLETELFGEMSFDANWFECITVDCAKIANDIAGGSADDTVRGSTALSRNSEIRLFEGFRELKDVQSLLQRRSRDIE